MEIKEYLERLQKGCNEYIYTGSFNGEEPYNTGWRCGSKVGGGMVLYCQKCNNRIEEVKKGLEKEVKND